MADEDKIQRCKNRNTPLLAAYYSGSTTGPHLKTLRKLLTKWVHGDPSPILANV